MSCFQSHSNRLHNALFDFAKWITDIFRLMLNVEMTILPYMCGHVANSTDDFDLWYWIRNSVVSVALVDWKDSHSNFWNQSWYGSVTFRLNLKSQKLNTTHHLNNVILCYLGATFWAHILVSLEHKCSSHTALEFIPRSQPDNATQIINRKFKLLVAFPLQNHFIFHMKPFKRQYSSHCIQSVKPLTLHIHNFEQLICNGMKWTEMKLISKSSKPKGLWDYSYSFKGAQAFLHS